MRVTYYPTAERLIFRQGNQTFAMKADTTFTLELARLAKAGDPFTIFYTPLDAIVIYSVMEPENVLRVESSFRKMFFFGNDLLQGIVDELDR